MKATKFFFSTCTKPVDKQKWSATKASEPQNSYTALTRPCKRIVAGFLLPSVYRQRESGHNNARGCPVAVSSSPTRGLEAFGWRVLMPNWRLRWVEWRVEESVNGKHVEKCVHERRPQHRSSQDRRPHMACAPRYRTFFFSASKKPVDKQK